MFPSGGSAASMMGAVAKSARAGGARTIGVIPEVFSNDNEFTARDQDAHELIVCKSMTERKARMQILSDGFIVLPGGIGTLEELFEGWHFWNCSVCAAITSLCGHLASHRDSLNSVGWSLLERTFEAHRHRRPARVQRCFAFDIFCSSIRHSIKQGIHTVAGGFGRSGPQRTCATTSVATIVRHHGFGCRVGSHSTCNI